MMLNKHNKGRGKRAGMPKRQSFVWRDDINYEELNKELDDQYRQAVERDE